MKETRILACDLATMDKGAFVEFQRCLKIGAYRMAGLGSNVAGLYIDQLTKDLVVLYNT